MSYVIQNFSLFTKSISLTPRLKYFIILNNLLTIFSFFKSFFFFYHIFYFNNFKFFYFFYFFKFFFSKTLITWFKKMTFKTFSFYDNNLTKSYIFFFYRNLLFFSKFKNNSLILSRTEYDSFFLYNQYFFSIKVINVDLLKTYFKNFFFFLFFFSTIIWYQSFNFLKFYLKFFLLNFNLYVSPSYNGFFLSIYNI